MIREALDQLEREGAIALTTTPRTVEYFRDGDRQRFTSDLLAPHTGYLCAVLGVQDRIGLVDVRAKLGFLPAERPPNERDQLMAQMEWPLETLTLEELQARAKG